jgi:Ca-activated chloride channel homolog
MEWARPQALYLILPVCIGWLALCLYARVKRQRAAEKFIGAPMRPRILPADHPYRFWAKTMLVMLGLVSALVALAQPRWGSYYEEVRIRGVDVYVLIDVSKSMLAKDVSPTRLDRAKADVRSLLNRLDGNRVGLIAFAGKTSVKCPLTTDHEFYRMSLNDLDTTSAPRGGTAIGDAIRKALEVMPREAERDKVILLFTDGDDQNSYPEDAATRAAEQGVNIYCIGLGDPAQAALLEQTDSSGKRIESQLNEKVLTSIASITGGQYLRTGYYDIDELYSQYLSKRSGEEATEQRRIRLHERYQIFLGLAILLLLLEVCIRHYPVSSETSSAAWVPVSAKSSVTILLFALLLSGWSNASEPAELVREGLELYAKDDFDGAREKFTSAEQLLKGDKAELAALTAFDLACVFHRKGDTAEAQANYLRAAQARDKRLSAEAHFNLGVLTSESARAAAGEDPIKVAAEKRAEIVDKLKQAIKTFRNCLSIEPTHAGARKNIELIRQWIKYHNEKWRELDRKKLRDETDLFQFLDYIIGSEQALRGSLRTFNPKTPLDLYAEHKRAQDDLLKEIDPLKEKIRAALTKSQAPQQPGTPAVDPKMMEQAAAMLDKFAEAAASRMQEASAKIAARDAPKAAEIQRTAILELDKIWDALAPLEALLDRALKEQTYAAATLDKSADRKSAPKDDAARGVDEFKKLFALGGNTDPKVQATAPKDDAATLKPERAADLADIEDRTARRSLLLERHAQHQLKQLEQQPAPAPTPPPAPGTEPAQPQQPDPEKMKEWLRDKVIPLAPKAAEKISSAAKSVRGAQPFSAFGDAEEGRKILDEIAKSRPQDPNQKQDQKDKDKQEQKDKDQQKDKQDQQDKDKKDQQDKKDEEQKKKDEQKQKEKDQKDKQDKDDKNKEEKKEGEGADPKQLSDEDAEALLRKVREREQARKDKQKAERAKAILVPVDKDY